MDLRRSLTSAVLATALTPAMLLTPSGPWAASSAALLADPIGPARQVVASPASWPAYCAGSLPVLVPPLDRGTLSNPDDHSDLSLSTSGLPDETAGVASIPAAVTAGSGWHDFRLTASLPLQSPDSDLTNSPPDMKWIVFVSNGSEKGNPSDLLASRVQYLNGSVWSDLGRWAGASTRLVTTAFDVDNNAQTATASLRLRFMMDAGAPAGTAYIVEFGSYVDADQACTHFTFGANMTAVRTPGSASGSPRALQYAAAGAVIIVAGSAMVLVACRRKQC